MSRAMCLMSIPLPYTPPQGSDRTEVSGKKRRFSPARAFEFHPPAGGPMEQFSAFLQADREANARLVKLTGVRLD